MDESDRIEKLRKKLYSQDKYGRKSRRRGFSQGEYDVEKKWSQPTGRKVKRRRKPASFLRIFFTFSVIFFVGAVVFGSLYFLGGRNVVSTENVDIKIQGPSSVGGGEELLLQISITNENNTTLQLTDLLIEYPEGTRSADNVKSELLRFQESIGDISPGERVKKTARSILFGEENTQKDIRVIVEYRIEGSNAIFFAEKIYQITLSSSPVNISVRSFDEVISGQDIEFIIDVTSNSTTDVEDVVLKVEYPFGFEFKESNIPANYSDTIWELGDLKPEEKRSIRIIGNMIGQDDEERVFRFSLGVRDEFDIKKLATSFLTITRSIIIQRPFIDVNITLNDEVKREYIFDSGKRIKADVVWRNNIPDTVNDVEVEVTLLGVVVDESSVMVEQGFYDSIDNKIRWTSNTRKDLVSLGSSQVGHGVFTFKTYNVSTDQTLKNPEIVLDVTIRGRRVSDANISESIDSSVTRSIKISSDLAIRAQSLYSSGSFVNTGPIPPRAEKETTYTIVWTITNSANHISDAKVTSTLPSYVNWLGVISPVSEDISFNPSNNQITWNAGEIPQGVGMDILPKEVSFRVGLIPSISQIGAVPVLLDTSTIRGFDQFTETGLQRSVPELTTNLQTETGFQSGQDKVTP